MSFVDLTGATLCQLQRSAIFDVVWALKFVSPHKDYIAQQGTVWKTMGIGSFFKRFCLSPGLVVVLKEVGVY